MSKLINLDKNSLPEGSPRTAEATPMQSRAVRAWRVTHEDPHPGTHDTVKGAGQGRNEANSSYVKRYENFYPHDGYKSGKW